MSTEVVQQTIEEPVAQETPVEESPKVEEPVVEEPQPEVESESDAEPMSVEEILAQFPELEITENAERSLINQGKLSRKTRFKTSARVVYLFNDYAIFAKKTKGKEIKLKQLIDLSQSSVKDSKNKVVEIKSAGRAFILIASSAEEAEQWKSQFAAQIAEVAPIIEEEPVEAEAPEKESEAVAEEPVEEEAAPEKESEAVAEEPVEEEEAPKESEAVAEEPVVEEEPAEKESEAVAEEAVEEEAPEKESEAVAEEPVVEEEPAEKESEAVAEEPVEEEEEQEAEVEEEVEELTEEQKVVKEIIDQFDGVPANAERVLLKQGDLVRKDRFGTAPRKVYLFNDIAIIAKDSKKGITLKQVIDLSTAVVKAAKKSVKNSVVVKTPVRSFVFKAADVEEQQQWTEVFTTTVKAATAKTQAEAAISKNGGGEALLKAVTEGDLDALAALIEQKADFAHKNEEGMTALHVAALEGAVETIKMMASKGYALDVVDTEGHTALARAATTGSRRTKSITCAFVEAGAEANAVLRMAAKSNQTEPLMALIASGIVEAADSDEKTALFYAVEADAKEAATLLVEAGANVNQRDVNKNTALHLAASQEMADFLAASGARVMRNDAGEKPQFATKSRSLVVAACDKVCEKSEWVADSSSSSCNKCSTEFAMFNRRHHCRRCGDMVCAACSSNRMVNEAGKVMRACDGCVNEMQAILAQAIEEAKAEIVEAAEEQVEETTEEVVEAAEEKVEETTEEVVEAAEEKVEETAEETTEEKVEETAEEVEETVEEPVVEEEVEEPKKEAEPVVEEEAAEPVKESVVEEPKEAEVAEEAPIAA